MNDDVEIELRIPTLTIKWEEEKSQRIDNSLVRFRKVIQVPAFPQPGSQTRAHHRLRDGLRVRRLRSADWHEHNRRFVLACKYPKQLIFPHEFQALMNDL